MSHDAKANALHAFNKLMLGEERPTNWAFRLAALYDNEPRADGPGLVEPFSSVEIKAVFESLD